MKLKFSPDDFTHHGIKHCQLKKSFSAHFSCSNSKLVFSVNNRAFRITAFLAFLKLDILLTFCYEHFSKATNPDNRGDKAQDGSHFWRSKNWVGEILVGVRTTKVGRVKVSVSSLRSIMRKWGSQAWERRICVKPLKKNVLAGIMELKGFSLQ